MMDLLWALCNRRSSKIWQWPICSWDLRLAPRQGFREVFARFSWGFREVFARFSRGFRFQNIFEAFVKDSREQKKHLINFCVPQGPPRHAKIDYCFLFCSPEPFTKIFWKRRPRENLAKTKRKPRENKGDRCYMTLGFRKILRDTITVKWRL